MYCCCNHGYRTDTASERLHQVAVKARYARLEAQQFERDKARYWDVRDREGKTAAETVRWANGQRWQALMKRARRELHRAQIATCPA